MYNPFTLKNKVVLVTGASSGIGRSVAIECSKLGAKVILTGRNKDRLNETFLELFPGDHQQYTADLNCSKDIESLIGSIPEINGLVHCAGIVKTVPFQFINSENLNEVFGVNFTAPLNLNVQLLKRKKITKGSSIVFISSISGVYCTMIGNSIYSATKGALNGLMKTMALELASKKIRVNSVNPGMINTNFLNEGNISEEQITEDIKKYPLKRYGLPEEVAYAVIYLLSDAAAWVTGSNLLIDGGFTLT